LIATGPAPRREEGLLQNVLDVRGRQQRAQAGREHRRMPGEQLTERGLVAAGQAVDQLVVVHHYPYSRDERIGSRIAELSLRLPFRLPLMLRLRLRLRLPLRLPLLLPNCGPSIRQAFRRVLFRWI
jgi:hypothetical protein